MKKISFIVAIFLFSTCNLLTFAQDNKESNHFFSLEGGMLYLDMETMQLLGEWGQQDKMTLREYLSTKLPPTKVEEFLKLYQTASQAEASQQSFCNCVPTTVYPLQGRTPQNNYSTTGNPSTERYVWGAAHKLYARIGGGSTATASYLNFHSGDSSYGDSNNDFWYNYVCSNPSGYPTNCGCEKQIYIKMGYDARLNVNTYNSGGTQNRNAAVAEDAMALIAYNINDPYSVQILGVRHARLISYRNTTAPTNTFSIRIGQMVANYMENAYGLFGYYLSNDQKTYFANLVDYNTPYPIKETTVNSYYGTGNYSYTMNKLTTSTIYLKPNVMKLVSLISNGHIWGSGKTGLLSNTYYCKSHTVSDYYLAGVIPYQNNPSTCCINKSGAWILNDTPATTNVTASWKNEATLRNDITTFFNAYPSWTAGIPLIGNSGTVSATPQCPAISSDKTETTTDNLSLAPNPTNKTLRILWNYALPDNVPLKIFDLQGREVLQETITKDSYGITLNLTELQAGMYLVVAYMPNGSVNTQKFTKL